MERELSRDPAVRLSVFVNAGLIRQVPTRFQFLQGQLEMAGCAYVGCGVTASALGMNKRLTKIMARNADDLPASLGP